MIENSTFSFFFGRWERKGYGGFLVISFPLPHLTFSLLILGSEKTVGLLLCSTSVKKDCRWKTGCGIPKLVKLYFSGMWMAGFLTMNTVTLPLVHTRYFSQQHPEKEWNEEKKKRLSWFAFGYIFLVCISCIVFFFNFRKLNKPKLEKGGAGDCGHESLMKCGFLRAIGEKTSRIFKWKIQLPSHTIGRAGSIFLGIWRCSTHTRLPIILWSCNCQILL